MKNSALSLAAAGLLICSCCYASPKLSEQKPAASVNAIFRHLKRVGELDPWLLQVKNQIIGSDDYRQFEKEARTNLRKGKVVTCSFLVGKDGSIRELELSRFQHSTPEEFDKKFVSLVQNSGPFGVPPNSVPNECETVIQVRAVSGKVKLQTFVNSNPKHTDVPTAQARI